MIDVIAEAEGISISSMQFKAMIGRGNIDAIHVPLYSPFCVGVLSLLNHTCWSSTFFL
jgi:hypothetical protein